MLKKIKVKVTCFWEDATQMHATIRRYTMNGTHRWKNIDFVMDDSYDRLIILTRPHKDQRYNPDNAITLLTEPPQSANIIKHPTAVSLPVYVHLPFWEHLTKVQYQDVLNGKLIKKTKILSSVTSELYNNVLPGYELRLQYIDLMDACIEDGFDLYGKKYSGTFFDQIKAYKGSLLNKYDGLWSYKYHFACENSFYPDYFTEKIADPIISECLCFYDGCNNIEEFIDERAFVKIEVANPGDSVEKMIRMINDNEWRKRIKYIRLQKQRLLFELNPLNLIWAVANEMDALNMFRLNRY